MSHKKQQFLTATIFDKRGKILSVGTNSYCKTHPVQAEFAKAAGRESAIYLHAEIAAIIKLRGKHNRARRIFIERYSKEGEPMLAKPCEICELALKMAGIEQIDYTGKEY